MIYNFIITVVNLTVLFIYIDFFGFILYVLFSSFIDFLKSLGGDK